MAYQALGRLRSATHDAVCSADDLDPDNEAEVDSKPHAPGPFSARLPAEISGSSGSRPHGRYPCVGVSSGAKVCRV